MYSFEEKENIMNVSLLFSVKLSKTTNFHQEIHWHSIALWRLLRVSEAKDISISCYELVIMLQGYIVEGSMLFLCKFNLYIHIIIYMKAELPSWHKQLEISRTRREVAWSLHDWRDWDCTECVLTLWYLWSKSRRDPFETRGSTLVKSRPEPPISQIP